MLSRKISCTNNDLRHHPEGILGDGPGCYAQWQIQIHNEEFERQHASRNRQIRRSIDSYRDWKRKQRIWREWRERGRWIPKLTRNQSERGANSPKPSLECQRTLKVRILKKSDVKGPKPKPDIPACFEGTDLEARWNALFVVPSGSEVHDASKYTRKIYLNS